MMAAYDGDLSASHRAIRGTRTTPFAGQRDPIRTPVTACTVPFSPISACTTYLTMPCVPLLHDIVPTEGIAINLDTFRAFIADKQGFQREFSMFTRECVGLV